ncbi:MAG: hypothetical protein RL662_1084 [Bacteroidota bacterium]
MHPKMIVACISSRITTDIQVVIFLYFLVLKKLNIKLIITDIMSRLQFHLNLIYT